MNTIANRIHKIQHDIVQCCEQYHRDPTSVQVMAVSKTRSVDEIQQAFTAGIQNFGENYVQEAVTKIHALTNESIIWHFIGPIQSNKTKLIAENFSWVHSVDRLKIAERLNAQRPTHLPALNVCIQVNIENETQKSGITLSNLPNLIEALSHFSRLKLCGLMVIPSINQDELTLRDVFATLRKAAAQWQLKTLSMGMSGDFKIAIGEGATIIRVGTTIFGNR